MPSTGQISCGKDDQRVADRHLIQGTSAIAPSCLRWACGGHAPGQRLQDRRGAAHGVRFERLAAREHQHDQRAGQVLAEQDRRDDGDAGQQVGAELAAQELEEQLEHQGNAAQDQGQDQRPVDQRQAKDGAAYVPGEPQQ